MWRVATSAWANELSMLADAGGWRIRAQQHNLDRWTLVHPKQRVGVEITLLHGAFAHRDFTMQRGGQRGVYVLQLLAVPQP